jgi:hypothetical protein
MSEGQRADGGQGNGWHDDGDDDTRDITGSGRSASVGESSSTEASAPLNDAEQSEGEKTSFRGAKGDNGRTAVDTVDLLGDETIFCGAKEDSGAPHERAAGARANSSEFIRITGDPSDGGWHAGSNDEEPVWVAEAPVDVLPEPVARLAGQIGNAVGCDPGFALGPILAVVGGLIGGTVRLQIAPRWFASAGILQASVGWPGDGRGRAQTYVADPAMNIDLELAYALEQEEKRDELIQAEMRMSKADKARQRERAERRRKAGEFDIKSFYSRQVFVQNGTLSDWLHLLARESHMRGIAVVSHDLARQGLGVPGYGNGVASGFGQASDRQSFMRVWDEAPMDSGRGSEEGRDWLRTMIRPTISVTGTVTPPMLQAMWNDKRDDGFWERWLFVSPDVRPKAKPGDCAEVCSDTLREWSEILAVLWERARRVYEQCSDAPELLHWDEDGKAVFDEGLRRHVEQMNHDAFPHRLRGPWTRLGTYAGRFWLILTVLESVVDSGEELGGSPTASAETARGAWRLVEYFKTHTRRVLSARPGERQAVPPGVAAELVMRWIRKHPDRKVVHFRDLTRRYSTAHGYDRETLLDGVSLLVRRRVLREVLMEANGERGAGRPKSKAWAIGKRAERGMAEHDWRMVDA